MIKVVIIGSGNVAQHLIKVMQTAVNVNLVQVFARNKESILHLIDEVKITSNYNDIKEADVYIISVSDNAIAEVSNNLPFTNRLVVHTSGTSELSVLNSKNRKGVFYPLQTFSKDKEIDFSSIPICLEAENDADFKTLEKLAQNLSQKVFDI
ncbi:MAG: NAD(P)-binding domain-containing protein, partial [Flavobacterium sp.]